MTFRSATLLCLAAHFAHAQQTPVIRTETRVVLVDTVVTSKQGEYIHDLTAKDFRLWEDNKEQTIQSVSFERGSTEKTSTASRPRYMVLFVGGMEDSARIAARQAIFGFIDANAEENRRIAVVSYSGALRIDQNFTGNATHLKEGVNRAMSTGLATEADAVALDTIRALETLAGNLGVLPGRKEIVFLSGGLPQSSTRKAALTAAIEACNQSDVAVYPIDVQTQETGVCTASHGAVEPEMIPRGQGMQGEREDSAPPAPNRRGAESVDPQLLFHLASATGGFVIPNPGELQRGLQKIGEEQSEYYVLSFTPADSPSESKAGTCHALRVKVDRRGTTVRARADYCESKPQDLFAGTLTGQELERRAGGAQSGSISATMQLSYFYLSPGIARVHLAMEIPADALKFQNQKGKPHAEFNLLGIASTSDGVVGARFSDALKLDPDGKGKPLHYEKEFKIVPGQYSFTIAFSSGGESFGKLEAPLTVDPRQAGEIALSGLVLSRETQPAAELGLGMAGLGENRTPLVADDMQIVPSGSNRFTKSEPGFFYFEVYAPDPASVRVSVRVLDRKTGEPKSASGPLKLDLPNNGGNAIPAGFRLPIDALSPGSYALEITAVNSTGKQVRRTADFEVR